MSSFFEGLEPERVWHHFEEICRIPHGPGNEDGVRKYIADFAEKTGLKYYYHPQASLTDYGQRVLAVYKQAAPGFENKPTVVLQAHLDMVCVPNDQIFPLKLQYCDGQGRSGAGWVKAGGFTDIDGTSLGADDGIGVAIVLAILEDNRHSFGPVEGFFTVKEETGMDGARDFDPGLLKGRIYINLDEEELRTITYGCAGG
jgi:dipeptidase D